MTTPKPKRRWFQYSLRTLLVFVTLSAIPCSWLSVKMRQAERQREAVTAIEKLGGRVRWVSNSAGWPAWLRGLLGDDFFNSVDRANLSESEATLTALSRLKELSQLEYLELHDTHVTDAGVERLATLSCLWQLDLSGTRVTDEGVKRLKRALPHCTIER